MRSGSHRWYRPSAKRGGDTEPNGGDGPSRDGGDDPRGGDGPGGDGGDDPNSGGEPEGDPQTVGGKVELLSGKLRPRGVVRKEDFRGKNSIPNKEIMLVLAWKKEKKIQTLKKERKSESGD